MVSPFRSGCPCFPGCRSLFLGTFMFSLLSCLSPYTSCRVLFTIFPCFWDESGILLCVVEPFPSSVTHFRSFQAMTFGRPLFSDFVCLLFIFFHHGPWKSLATLSSLIAPPLPPLPELPGRLLLRRIVDKEDVPPPPPFVSSGPPPMKFDHQPLSRYCFFASCVAVFNLCLGPPPPLSILSFLPSLCYPPKRRLAPPRRCLMILYANPL